MQLHEFLVSPQRPVRWADGKELSNIHIPRSLWATLQRTVHKFASMLSVLSSKYAFYLPQIAWDPTYEALAAQQKLLLLLHNLRSCVPSTKYTDGSNYCCTSGVGFVHAAIAQYEKAVFVTGFVKHTATSLKKNDFLNSPAFPSPWKHTAMPLHHYK